MREKKVFGLEEDLWASFKKGDEEAYETIFKNHYKLLLNYGLRINPDREEIKDCIQQLFTDLWESRQRLGTNSSIKMYLLASLRRSILRKLNASYIYSDIDKINPAFYIETSEESKIIKDQLEMDRVKKLSESIQKLPDRQKEALYLKYYGDQSFPEIAKVMGITTRAVYKLIYKALDHLTTEFKVKKV
jgi:RNA polymerase sigma factor (sigma-70 family)